MTDRIINCTGCEAIIVFARHYRTGSPMPFDADPIDLGAFVSPAERDGWIKKGWVLTDGKAYPAGLAIDTARMVQAEQPTRVHQSHWATCPEAQRFRKTKRV